MGRQFTLIYLLLTTIAINVSFGGEYAILKEPQTMNYYDRPDGKILKLLNEDIMGKYSNRLVYLEYETNVGNTKWAFMPDPFNILSENRLTNVWIKIDDTVYRFKSDKENGELFYQLLKEADVIKNEEGKFKRTINLTLANYLNGEYIFISYTVPQNIVWDPGSYLFLKYNGKYYKAIEDANIYENIYFYGNFIILYDGDSFYSYNTKFNSEKLTNGNGILDFVERNNFLKKVLTNILDSHVTFDTNNGILTAYLRVEEGKPFVVEKYKFNNGKFELLQNQLTQTYILTGDNVNVRSEAATNGAVLLKLSKGAKVTLLKRSDVALTVGDKKGYWAFIDTGIAKKDGEETIKGWVFDYYLKEEGK